MEHTKRTRIILFGKSGEGKSAFGNTLIGKPHFKVSALSPVPMPLCETAAIKTESGRNLKIVETPGIIELMNSNMLDLVQSHFDFLAPGPNAIIIVLMPRRFSQEDETAVKELFRFFGDDHFLEHTILVMLRKSEIVDVCTNIAEFMENTASDSMKKLYKGCGSRIVAVENNQSWIDRQTDAEEVFKEIDKLEGYYDWKYFSKVHELNKMVMEIKKPINEMKETKPDEKHKDKNKEYVNGCKLI